jgi:hypothetical protein
MNETMTKIGSYTVSATGGDTTVTFSNIPSYYTDLRVYLSVRSTDSAAQGMNVAFNGTTTGFSGIYLYSDGTNKSSSSLARYVGSVWGTNGTASTFNSTEIYIPNYTSSYPKNFSVNNVADALSSTGHENIMSGTWSNTSPITSISFTMISASNFAQNSEFTLYGIKDMTKVVGNSLKANGGIVTTDGTYVYHIFNSTGSFQPSTRLLADYMVVGGGGGGQAGGPQGTGGGGGYVSVTTGVTFTPGVGYVATIGGGGAGAVAGGATAVAGTSSTFYNLTSSGGGVGGVNYYYPDRGGSSGNVVNGTSTGYIGGQTANGNDNSHLAGGGGAGAGANGLNSSATTGTVGSIGGDGFSHPVGNVYGLSAYYGGGGNGGTEGTGTNGGWGAYQGYIPTYRSKGGGGWGGGQFPTSNPASLPTAGLTNTGGGGGGATWGYSLPIVTGADSGAAGGSGVVIVRYKA